MTAAADARTQSEGIAGLNFLLRGELAAVNAWQHALRSAENRRTVDVPEILRFASDHQRAVAALGVVVRQLGGIPASLAATAGAFALLVDAATVHELLEGEEAGLSMYEAMDGTLKGDASDLVAIELIPRQRRHVTDVTALLARLMKKKDPNAGEARPGPGEPT